MAIKQFIRKIHLWLGLLSGIVIFTVAITGCLYAFEEEIRGVLYKELLTVKTGGAPVKPFSEFIAVVKKQYPKATIKNIRIKKDPSSSVEVVFKNKQSIYINPYTLAILGSIDKEEDFFGVVLRIHRSLCLGDTGKLITGVSACIFTIMLISGIILWWPNSRKNSKQKFSIKRNAQWRKLSYDLHSVLGFYASWIIIFTALTGLIWSFKWAENTMYWATNSKNEERKQLHSAYVVNAAPYPINKVVMYADSLCPDSKEYSVNMPEDSSGVIRLFMRYDYDGFFRKNDQLYFDQYSGALIRAELYSTASVGDKLKATNYYIHTGKRLGFTGQLLVFFASLIVASLPITGFIIWWGKRRK